MAETEFFEDAARAAVRKAVEDVESHTSAEVVVSVRKISGVYTDVDAFVGAAAGFGCLLLLLFLPDEFEVVGMPIQVALFYGVGFVASRFLWRLRRALVPEGRQASAVALAARAAFVDRGISRTTGRNGILVFVSIFERKVEVVPDIGVDTKTLGEPWLAATKALTEAVARNGDFEGFLAALRRLGPPLGGAMPRRDDDVNELADEPVMA
jgi:putative membrane protein